MHNLPNKASVVQGYHVLKAHFMSIGFCWTMFDADMLPVIPALKCAPKPFFN